jgi:DNA replication protein DnaC
MMTAWRNKSSTHWNGEPDWSGDFQQRINEEEAPQFMQQHEQDQAAKDIDSIRTACGVTDEESLIDQARHDKAMSDYIQNSLTALENLFEPGLSRTNSENNTNNYLLQVYSRDPNFPTYKSIQSELKKNWITESSATPKKEGQKAFNIHDPVTKKSPYNYQQQRLLDQMATYLQELKSDLKPQSKLVLLYGGPGVGKTHTIIALQQLAQSLGNGIVVCAPTGSAAANIPHGQTIHSLFGFRVNPSDMTTDAKLPPMSPIKLAAARITFHGKNIFLIDEASMLGPIGLAHIDQRLKEITG